MKRFVYVLVVLFGSVGCTIVVDPGRLQGGAVSGEDGGGARDDGGVAAAEDDGGARDDAGEQRCAEDGFACRAGAPPGWSGPIVLVTGEGEVPPPCPAAAPVTELVTRSGWSASAATCGCQCAAPLASQMSCANASLRTSSSCGVTGSSHAGVAGSECKSIATLPSTGAWSASTPAFSASGTCAAQPTVATEPVAWAASHRACSAGTPAECAGGICAPPLGQGQRLCVYVEGEVACPAAFPEQLLTAQDVSDQRGCSECTCGSIVGSCSGSVQITNGCGGSTLLHQVIALGACTSARSISGSHYLQGAFSPSGTCAPSEVSPIGALEPQGLRTICCASS